MNEFDFCGCDDDGDLSDWIVADIGLGEPTPDEEE